MCSNNGNGKLLSIDSEAAGVISNGSNVALKDYFESGMNQCFRIDSVGAQRIIIVSYYDLNKALTSYGSSDGSSSGRSSTSAGNVFMQTYSSTNMNQVWELVPQLTEMPISEGVYKIRSAYSNLYLSRSGTSIVQTASSTADTQKWEIVYLENGYYEIKAYNNTGYQIGVVGGADSNGTDLALQADNDGVAQRFRIIPSTGGTFRIAAACSAKQVFDVRGPSTSANTPIQTWRYSGASQQRWYLNLIEEKDPLGDMGFQWVFPDSEPHLRITSDYRTFSRPNHYGVDFADSGISGDMIYSPVDGIVLRTFYNDADAGYGVVISTGVLDSNGRDIRVACIHMVAGSVMVEEEQIVTAGTALGRVGNTGDVDRGESGTGGIHLHFSAFSGPNRNNSPNWPDYTNCINVKRFYPDINFINSTSNVT